MPRALAHALAARRLVDNVRGYTVYGDYSKPNPQRRVVDAVASGAVGTAVVSATDPGTSVSGSTTVTVTAAVLVSIQVTPSSPSVAKGTTQGFVATGVYSDGSTQDLTNAVTWNSSDAAAATIPTQPMCHGH